MASHCKCYIDTDYNIDTITTRKFTAHGALPPDKVYATFGTFSVENNMVWTKLTSTQYYKPWETTAEEDSCIQDQLAEVHETIKREVEEHEARVEQEANRQQSASQTVDIARDAQVSHSGKERDANELHQPSATNGTANGSHHSPKDQDMTDDHAQDPGHEAVRIDAIEHALDSNVSSHETIADDPSSDNHAENEEDVVEEAAEDTLIY
jgi:hypothetical protein